MIRTPEPQSITPCPSVNGGSVESCERMAIWETPSWLDEVVMRDEFDEEEEEFEDDDEGDDEEDDDDWDDDEDDWDDEDDEELDEDEEDDE